MARYVRGAGIGVALVATLVLAWAVPGLADGLPCQGIAAEGFGAGAAGGTTVYQVTTLADSGPGSLRDAISESGRCIVFTGLAGEINLEDHLWVRHAYITIDGFTADPPGITLVNRGLVIRGPLSNGFDAHDVVVRGLRIRHSHEDNLQIAYGAYNVLIDHVSTSHAGDGNLDITFDAHDITVAWSVIGPGNKSMLVKYGASRVSLHHNLFLESFSRNPAVASDDEGTPALGTTADVRNNVVWEWGQGSGTAIHHGARANVIANVYASPGSDPTDQGRALVVCPGGNCPWSGEPGNAAQAYARDNVSDDSLGIDLDNRGNVPAPFAAEPVATDLPCVALRRVLAEAGARPLDAFDAARFAAIDVPICTGTATTLATSIASAGLLEPVTFTATVTPVPPAVGPVGGSVSFFGGGVSLGTVPLSDGVAAFTTSTLPVGATWMTAVYAGDGWLDPSVAPQLKQIVRNHIPSTTVLVATANPTYLGEAVTLVASVLPLPPAPGPATGTVRFRDGANTLAVVPLAGGVASYTTTTLPAGLRVITASYGGDFTFEVSASPDLVLAVGGGSAVTLTASPALPRFGEPVLLTVRVLPVPPETSTPAGFVALRDGAATLARVPLAAGTATQSLAALGIGAHTLTALYEGQDPFAPKLSGPLTVRVVRGASMTALVSDDPVTDSGQAVRLTATVTATSPAQGVPTGSVRFRTATTTLATVPLAGGVAVFTSSQLAPGQYAVTAAYLGDTRFEVSTSSAVQQVVGGGVTVAVGASVNPSVAGQAVALSATVQPIGAPGPTPTGLVTFKDGTKVLGSSALVNGVATFTTASLAVRAHLVTARYEGGPGYAAATSAIFSHTVRKGATTVTLQTSDSTGALGQVITFTADVRAVAPAGGTPVGTVKFFAGGLSIGGVNLSAGRAVLNTTKLLLGLHQIRAVYLGSPDFEGSQSGVIAQQIGP